MVILASEDVGNADPDALGLAVAAAHAVAHVGMPEAQHALAQAAVYLSLAPSPTPPTARSPPRALACASTAPRRRPPRCAPPSTPAPHSWARARYDYPHDHPGHVAAQDVMPAGLEGMRFYQPDKQEARLRERLEEIRRRRGGRGRLRRTSPDARGGLTRRGGGRCCRRRSDGGPRASPF